MSTSNGKLESAGARRRDLHHAMADLEQSISVPAASPGWSEGVGRGLSAVRTALEAHIAEVESPDGLLAEITSVAPRLQPACHELAEEHDTLLGTMDRAERDLLGAVQGGADDRARLRRRVVSLLGRLTLHRQAGADLVYDAYMIDIAASD